MYSATIGNINYYAAETGNKVFMYQDIIGHVLTKKFVGPRSSLSLLTSISGKGKCCLYKSDLMTNKLRLGSEGFHLHK